jgi:hypothetical protein
MRYGCRNNAVQAHLISSCLPASLPAFVFQTSSTRVGERWLWSCPQQLRKADIIRTSYQQHACALTLFDSIWLARCHVNDLCPPCSLLISTCVPACGCVEQADEL